ncbi:MAG: putative sugar O-methyltransferase [Actinomycetota bacterium]|nr:putative sugar O-methyltransferase [Actinomycetota bacterium]
MTDWARLNDRLLDGIERCDPLFRPTNFWTPGLRELLADLERNGLETFKSWPTAGYWFYPRYGAGLSRRSFRAVVEKATATQPGLRRQKLTKHLNGFKEAQRDLDAVRLFWDQSRWPFDLVSYGESEVGAPRRLYPLTDDPGVRWGKPYLNYLLCLAALSHHVDVPPSSFLEIGGGFGALGEIVLQRSPDGRYLNLDIPPLLTVASYYLTELFGSERVVTYDQVSDEGSVDVPSCGCLPNWRLPDVRGHYDVFVNSFSFQEMEPEVVDSYISAVARLGVTYAVSLNSKLGKRTAVDGQEGGVVDPVTSGRIVGMFESRGYSHVGSYQDPLIRSAGEITVFKRPVPHTEPSAQT